MGRAPKSRAPSKYEHWNSQYEQARACALNLGPSHERARASISSIPYVVNSIFPKPKLKKKISRFFKSHINLKFCCFTFSLEIFLWILCQLWSLKYLSIFSAFSVGFSPVLYHSGIPWCSPSTLRESSPSTSEPSMCSDFKSRARSPSKHQASMYSDPSLSFEAHLPEEMKLEN